MKKRQPSHLLAEAFWYFRLDLTMESLTWNLFTRWQKARISYIYNRVYHFFIGKAIAVCKYEFFQRVGFGDEDRGEFFPEQTKANVEKCLKLAFPDSLCNLFKYG